MEDAVAVGRLDDGRSWIGFARRKEGYRVVSGTDGEELHSLGGDADDLLALAYAYFADPLAHPPDSLAATQADVADLVRHLGGAERDPTRRALLSQAVDAIDDGDAADAVIAALTAALSGDPEARLRRLTRRSRPRSRG